MEKYIKDVFKINGLSNLSESPYICNGAILKINSGYLFAYRGLHSKKYSATYLCELDEHFSPRTETHRKMILERSRRQSSRTGGEDPRLIWHDNYIIMPYTDRSNQFLAYLDRDYSVIKCKWASIRNHKDGEKNWQFFSKDNKLKCVYEINPFSICDITQGSKCNSFSLSERKSLILNTEWQWGELRGGTSPVLVGDEYFAFFHSSCKPNGEIKRYFMGMYSFSANPPYHPTRISTHPIETGDREECPLSYLWQRSSVLFPSGAHYDDSKDLWYISYGLNDHLCKVAVISHEEILKTLIPVTLVDKRIMGV